MGSKRLALEAGETPRLELSWGLRWKRFVVALDGKVVGTVDEGASALKKGVSFKLPDRSTLRIRMLSRVFPAELSVTRDGVPLPGSDTDPERQIRTAMLLLYILAGFKLLMGGVALVWSSEEMGGLGSVLMGAVFGVLGYFVARGTRAGALLAILLYGSDMLLSVVESISAGGQPNFFGLLIRTYIIIMFTKAAQATWVLHQRGEAEADVSPQS
ncbi:hypothetical protein LY474_15305 [Myxococcus stipitatus]|uniref:hypothetical protein n=1 Tax=Myxococcus stipitatus TaxID=83455 RepID=UPI001F1CD700|nr:hypothetical protein [Myxococcus stipitatus]MCE9669179.1 hypothetical protein [Myxococcus stipitatus]